MITRLDVLSARKISAGQVITDPASVLKELLENSLDAGATHVTIRLKRYGLEAMEVADDGCGIPMDGVIADGGLREGATTPPAAVARDDQAHTADGGGRRRATAGLPWGGRSTPWRSSVTVTHPHVHPPTTGGCTVCLVCDAAAPDPSAVALAVAAEGPGSAGTTVTVEQLFEHLPVRRRELEKNARKKLLQAVLVVKQYAVSHPHVRILLTHQEDPARQSALISLVSLSGSRDLQRSVAEAYGAQCLATMAPVDWVVSDYCDAVTGLLSKVGGGGRATADRQIIALDGRLVDLPRIKKAINDAFQQCLPNASQRLCAAFFLQLQTRRDRVDYDVNVNPDKRKVIFADEEGFAAQLYGLALKDLQTSAESVELDRAAREVQHRVEGKRLDALIKERRTPVSATAFTQFVFRREPGGDSGSNPGLLGASPPSPAAGEQQESITRMSAELLRDATAAGEDESDGEEALLHNSSSSSNGSLPSSADASSAEDEAQSEDASAPTPAEDEPSSAERSLKRLRPTADDAPDDTAEADRRVSVLSDITNGLREEGHCQCGLSFPPLARLAEEAPLPLRPAAAGKAAAATKELAAQTESDLTQLFQKRSFKDMHIIGQFNHGFILARHGRDLFIIDQHASDEIYNYERLMQQYCATPQRLVVPAVVTMDGHEVELALAHADLLRQHGFQVAAAADGTAEAVPTQLLVHTVPVLPYDTVHPTDIQELVQQLALFHTITKPLRAVWHSLATKACRSSIMIGTALSERTMRQMVDRLGELEKPWNCPHGRPTMRHLMQLPPSPDF
ncbi:DNA mismatch repair protein PMS2 [Strigomonas culicis]|uniref:DNA mismatch repair protein PMS2 n=1 Tax=Strigomonas culicis TaxID=28005 RepID=S9VF32_9TRYP|nr:DNA mismatch repair protein PMS2 [Strigomonas culicis]|eukprot:EPY25631.1 DNA mismatch repair protein PMS2 [Strigomonas culicis]